MRCDAAVIIKQNTLLLYNNNDQIFSDKFKDLKFNYDKISLESLQFITFE